MVSREVVAKAKQAIKRTADFDYFFDSLKSPDWIMPLWDEGFFKDPYAPVEEGRYIQFPIWPASRYLVRMAELAPTEVAKVSLKIPRTENVRVYEDLIDVALKLPTHLAVRFVPKAKVWLESPCQLLLPEKLGDLVSRLAKGGQVKAALDLARTLITILPDPSVTQEPDEGEGEKNYRPAPQPRPRFEAWDYERILERNIPDLVNVAGEDTLVWLCDLLETAIRLSRRRADDEGPEDYSYIWRRTIEDHEQNTHHGLDDLLVTAVRDAAEQIARLHQDKVGSVIEILESRSWNVFRRIALHVMRLYADAVMDIVTVRLANQDLFNESVHEYRLLQRDLFVRLAPPVQQQIMGWIDRGPDDLEERTEFWERETGQRPSREQIERYRKSWQAKKLSLIHSALPESWQTRYRALVAELGEPEHEEFSAYTVSWRGPQSPKDVAELKKMSPSELTAFLATWNPDKAPLGFGPSHEGLGRTLTNLVAAEPSHFAEMALEFRGLDPTYVRSFLQGFRDALGQSREFSWATVVDLCLWVVEQPRTIESRVVPDWDVDPDWGWTRKAIAWLLSAGFEHESNPIPHELREKVWTVLRFLTGDPDPTPEDESESSVNKMEPTTLSVNSTRGEAMHAVVRYARWVRRRIDKESPAEKATAQGFDNMPEVRETLDAHLETSRDPSLAIRSVYGQWFPTLVWLDPSWSRSRVERIFLRDENLHHLRQAAWDAYIAFARPYVEVYKILKDEYRAAIERLGISPSTDRHLPDPDERLAEHLMVFYWQGVITLEDSSMAGFYDKASPALCAHALDFIARGLRETEEMPPLDVLIRLKTIWERRFQKVRNLSKPNPYFVELAEFGGWFASNRFDSNWAVVELLEVLRLVGRAEPDHLVVERLASLSESMPSKAVESLRLLVEGDQEGWGLLSWHGHARTILSSALNSDEPQAREEATAFVNWLAARGIRNFLELLSR